MHLLNPRFLPGGRKKLRDGLEAHNTILLFLQDYIDFTDQRKHKGKITFLGCGVPPHPLFFKNNIFLTIQGHEEKILKSFTIYHPSCSSW